MNNHQIKKNLFLFFLFLLSLSFISNDVSAKNEITIGGLKLLYPTFDVFQIGEPISVHISAYGADGFILSNTDFSCEFIIYSDTGFIMMNGSLENDPEFININKYVISDTSAATSGVYSYNINCESAVDQGSVSGVFIFNRTGKEFDLNDLVLIIGIIGIVFALLYISFNLNNVHFFLKLILQIFSLYFLYLIPNIVLSCVNDIVISFLKLYNGFLVIFWIYLFIYFTYEVLNYTGKLVNFKEKLKNRRGGRF